MLIHLWNMEVDILMMRKTIVTVIMTHEHPFSIVEDEAWMWEFQYGNSEFQ